MRIGLLLYGSLDTTTGGFRYDRRLVEALRAAGDDVTVHELPWYDYWPGLRAGCFGSPPSLDQYDVVLQDELAHPTLWGWNRRSDAETPVVSIVHHLRASERWSALRRRLYRFVERRYLGTVDGVVTTSHATAESVRALGFDGPLSVQHPAGDRFADAHTPTPRAVHRRAADGPLQVVAVGSVVPRKNLDGLVAAVAGVADCELTVVGSRTADQEYAARLVEQVRNEGLDERVSFTGFLDDSALEAQLRAADVLAVPSHHEGFGIVYAEAMGFGVPVIASAAGGAGDIVTHGANGYLVEPDDTAGLERLLDRLATDRELVARLGTEAMARWNRLPSYRTTAAALRSFLRSRIVNDRR